MDDQTQLWEYDTLKGQADQQGFDQTADISTEASDREIRVHDQGRGLELLCVFAASCYKWFLETVRSKIRFTHGRMSSYMRSVILDAFAEYEHPLFERPREMSRDVIFRMDWLPYWVLQRRWRSHSSTNSCRGHFKVDFEDELHCECDTRSFSLGQILTITGNQSEAQALTCSQYLMQVWPTTGIYILQLMEEVVVRCTAREHSVLRPDGTRISAKRTDSETIEVMVSGISSVVVEVCEQLAWLGAALRYSDGTKGVVEYAPLLSRGFFPW